MTLSTSSHTVKYSSPSNIALIKYWGKKGFQLPENPSISFTLSRCRTTTSVSYERNNRFELDFYFEGKKREDFSDKIYSFLQNEMDQFPFLKSAKLTIHSNNSFPHSTGIASSAASMSALAQCIVDLSEQINPLKINGNREEVVSSLARRGSGSASRSNCEIFGVWGEHKDFPGSSDEFAIDYLDVPAVFKDYRDSIVVVCSEEKSVSSTVGHSLMKNHPYREARYQNARERMSLLKKAIEEENLNEFCKLVEVEALELHGLMTMSDPSFILMKPRTLEIIDHVRKFRKKTGLPLCFTLDAGPNLHLLYPISIQSEVKEFFNDYLSDELERDLIIHDFIGESPVQKL